MGLLLCNAMVKATVCTLAVPCRAHTFMSYLHSLSASSCLTYDAKDCVHHVCYIAQLFLNFAVLIMYVYLQDEVLFIKLVLSLQ
jgi:hypothetical protein